MMILKDAYLMMTIDDDGMVIETVETKVEVESQRIILDPLQASALLGMVEQFRAAHMATMHPTSFSNIVVFDPRMEDGDE